MNISKIKSYFKSLEEFESLTQLRQHILDRFLLGSLAIGLVLMIFSVVPIYLRGFHLVLPLFGFLYLCLFLISIFPKTPYKVRVFVYLGIIFVCGGTNLVLRGFDVNAGLFFLALIAVVVFFIGFRGSLVALGIVGITLFAVGKLITDGYLDVSQSLPQQDPLSWVISAVIFLLITFLMILAFTTIGRRLDQNLVKAQDLTKTIEAALSDQQVKDERYRTLIDGTLDVIGIVTGDGVVKYVSPSVEMILGYTPEEVIGQNIFDSIHPEDVHLAVDALGPGVPADQIGPKLDLRVRHKDGSWRDLEVRGREMHDTPGILGTVVSCRDITERNHTLAVLRESTLFLNRMFTGLVDAVIISDNSTDLIKDCNPAALELFGYSREELLCLTVADLHAGQSSFRKFEKILAAAVLDHNHLSHFEYKLKRRGGIVFPVEVSVTPLIDTTGIVTGWVSVVRDISDRKVAERLLAEEREALKQDVLIKTSQLQVSNERLRELVELSPSVIYSMSTKKGAVLDFVSDNVRGLLGYSPAEILGDPEFWKKHIHPDDLARSSADIESSFGDAGGVTEYRFMHQDGRYRWIHDEIRVIRNSLGEIITLVGSWYDMTDRKLAEEALKESEAKYRALYTGLMDAFVSTDMEGRILDFNDAYKEMLGYSADELRKKSYQELTPKAWHSLEAAIVSQQILSRGYSEVYEKEYISKDGIVFPVELRTMLVRDNAGRPVSMWALVRDIRDRKKVESHLQASEERYRTLAEAAHDIIFIIDREDRVVYVNTFAAAVLGVDPKDVIGHYRTEYFKFASNDRQSEHLQQVFTTGKAIYDEFVTEFPGKSMWLSTWVVPLKDSSGNISAVLGVSRDITDRKQAEEMLQLFNEKLEEQVTERTTELTESHAQLRNLANQVIKLQEDERRRISRELHDEAGQALILLKYNLDALLGEFPDENQPFHKKLSESVIIIDQTMELIRNLSHSLRPPVMDVGGLHLSLRELCWDVGKTTGLKITYKGRDFRGLPDEIGISLYRFAQEALVNTLKHSKATRVQIHLNYQDHHLVLSIRDNGQGLEGNQPTRGIGLLGIEERINLLGGTLDIKSRTGKGLHLTARIPWVSP